MAILLHLIFLISFSTMPSYSQLHPSDVSALQQIRRNLDDREFFSTWDVSGDPCSTFTGVACAEDPNEQPNLFRVQTLELGTGLANVSGLTGILSPAIGNLIALQQLVIFPGEILGTIPQSVCNLRQLQYLSITGNKFSGEIPACIAGLLNLHTLDLGSNFLHGSVPSGLGSGSSQLKVLILESNLLTGSLPDFDSELYHIDLKKNQFSGKLPRLPASLRYLSASQNELSGDLSNLDQLPELSYLDLSSNTFTGLIQETIFEYPLMTLLLQRNNLTGGIPACCGPYLSGATVDLSRNNLTGHLPDGLAEVENLFVNNNRLVGSVPRVYVEKVYEGSMKTLYLQQNFFTGFPVPDGAGLPVSATLCLSYNCMDPPVKPPCPATGVQKSRPVNECPIYNG